MPGKAYYEISQDHEITAFGNDGQPVALRAESRLSRSRRTG